jgi:hypothetical protein
METAQKVVLDSQDNTDYLSEGSNLDKLLVILTGLLLRLLGSIEGNSEKLLGEIVLLGSVSSISVSYIGLTGLIGQKATWTDLLDSQDCLDYLDPKEQATQTNLQEKWGYWDLRWRESRKLCWAHRITGTTWVGRK